MSIAKSHLGAAPIFSVTLIAYRYIHCEWALNIKLKYTLAPLIIYTIYNHVQLGVHFVHYDVLGTGVTHCDVDDNITCLRRFYMISQRKNTWSAMCQIANPTDAWRDVVDSDNLSCGMLLLEKNFRHIGSYFGALWLFNFKTVCLMCEIPQI